MAELLVANGWSTPDSLAVHLREALPDDYIIVADPIVHRLALSTVVVGPQGLFVLHVKDWCGEIRPVRHGPWRERLESGLEIRHPNPEEEARQADDALRAFLRDEFPSLRPQVRHLVVFSKPGVRIVTSEATEPPAMTVEDAASAIMGTESSAKGNLLDEETREAVAVALRDRQLTISERARQPFVFRSGGVLGSGKKVWTVREAVAHMDRHPADGIYHLRNGTLARWLADQGADHLAALAREVVRQREEDPRIPLETFLIGTRLVRRPRLKIRPRKVNFGHILSGQSAMRVLRVQKGRGRGYLFGTLRSRDPWLRIAPNTFSGRPLNAVLTVSTDTLLISQIPQQTEILVESSASEQPVSVPVEFRVVGIPSALDRYLLRPLAGLIAAGLLGAGVGWLFAASGLRAPQWFARAWGVPSTSVAAWMLLIGLFWAVIGLIRGFFQHVAWPITYATGRWLFRTLAWGVALSLLVSVTLWSWQQPYSGLDIQFSPTTRAVASLLALAFSIVPAVLSEIWSARPAPDNTVDVAAQQPTLRPVALVSFGIILGFVMMASARLVRPTWERLHTASPVTTVKEWVGEQWDRLEIGVNGVVDRLYIRYYDRRAPIEPTRAASPTRQPPNPTMTRSSGP
jgi:hypothetical protein